MNSGKVTICCFDDFGAIDLFFIKRLHIIGRQRFSTPALSNEMQRIPGAGFNAITTLETMHSTADSSLKS
jgi:hypothetical protein